MAVLEWAAAMHEVMAALYRSLAQKLAPAELVTVEDLAVRLGVGVGTILQWESEGRLPRADRHGHELLWDRTVVERWLRSSRHGGVL